MRTIRTCGARRRTRAVGWIGCFVLTIAAVGDVVAAEPETVALRQAYNRVSARIDSLVRAMAAIDADAVDTRKLPDAEEALSLPDDVEVVAIFWADDEAKVWVNDHLVGETRLTPVEVVIPSLYLKADNVVRARCWDTDYVESGFLFGLYLRRNGRLEPVVVSDDAWTGVTGPVETITYAHSMPDIPEAKVIWGERTFGVVEMTTRFSAGRVQEASRAQGHRGFDGGARQDMSLHEFVGELAVLETERDRLRAELKRRSAGLSVPAFRGDLAERSLTLGKAGPLEEAVTGPVSEQVRQWAERLPPEKQKLVYPERRGLRGEGEATGAGDRVAGTGGVETRAEAYVPPSDRRNTAPGEEEGRSGVEGRGGGTGEGAADGRVGGGGSFGGRTSRLGLLVPTAILAAYAVYATREWKRLHRETG